ncbi:MFS siderochrome iron transporter [Paramyrothecium foliicola]|nr:MFS siderochrome iron transporter [Paramyrothecium foliicola]
MPPPAVSHLAPRISFAATAFTFSGPVSRGGAPPDTHSAKEAWSRPSYSPGPWARGPRSALDRQGEERARPFPIIPSSTIKFIMATMETMVQPVPAQVVDEKRAAIFDSEKNVSGSQSDDDSDAKSEEFQGGVQRVRAITSIWGWKTMWLMFSLFYLVSFADALLVSIQGSLNPYITSSFQQHGLLTASNVLSSIISGCCTLTLAKIIDIWGRVEGFLCMVVVVVVSCIMKATCKDMETYVGAHVLYWTGHIGMMYVIDIMLADMTSLRNRMIMIAVNNTPNIASTFAGPKIAELFYKNLNFRWAFGAFAIILVGVCLPVVIALLVLQMRAEKAGLIKKNDSGRTWYQSIWHYTVQFDVAGIILITATFVLILLPFSINAYAPKGWATGYIIAMEVVGVVCGALFYIWESKLAPVQFLPWEYLKERTIIGSCLLYAVMFISCFAWNSYFGSYLQVVHRLSITTAGYVLNSFSLTSYIFSPIFGVLISYTGRYKWVAYIGVPFMLLGTALLIPFRTPDTSVGILVMTQIFVGFGSGLFATCGQLAVQVPITHQEIAVVSAIWGLFGSIGASIGGAIAGGMWTSIIPRELMKRLPEASKDQAHAIFGDMVLQMSFADGTPERDAIVGAYADAQRKMVIVGACFMPLCALAIFLWKNVDLKKLEEEKGKQTKGTVW